MKAPLIAIAIAAASCALGEEPASPAAADQPQAPAAAKAEPSEAAPAGEPATAAGSESTDEIDLDEVDDSAEARSAAIDIHNYLKGL